MAKVEKYRKLPNGFPTLLNKMLRAVLVSRPLEAVRFFADYLEAEINRRTLCDLQLRQPCPSGLVQPTDPWVQYMSFVTIQRAIEALLREEQPEQPTSQSSFQWDDPRQFRVERLKCQASSGRRRITHRPFPWPPTVKAMPRCRHRFDRYGPIVKTISITSRAIRRYVTDESLTGLAAADHCQRRRPIANYWRQILRDCSVKADQWNRKTENSRRRRRSASLAAAEMTSSGVDEGEEGDGDGGSGTSIDPYMEPKRRRKARNDEGLAKIIYRELGSRFPPVPAEGEHPSEVEDKLPPGKASKAVQVELVHSILPRRYPPPAPTPSAIIDGTIPVEVFDKAVQVDLDDTSTEDRTSAYPAPDSAAAELDTDVLLTCPPAPMPEPLAIDWTLFLQPTTQPWTHSDINWMMEDEDDGQDVPAIQVEPSPAAEALAEEVIQLVDLDFPAATTVADAPAMPLLLGETDDPAGTTLADVPAEPLDLDNDAPTGSAAADVPAEPFDLEKDAPASSTVADVPAEPLMPAKESAAQLMDGDEVDDPFSDEGPPVTFH